MAPLALKLEMVEREEVEAYVLLIGFEPRSSEIKLAPQPLPLDLIQHFATGK